MSKSISFIYDYACEDEHKWSEVPSSVSLRSEFEFEDETRWPTIMREFVRFLESIGYEGIRDQVILVDKFGMEDSIGFFKTLAEDPTEEQTYHINVKDEE